MDKKILIWCGLVVILIIVAGLGIGYYVKEPEQVINGDSQYYIHLSRECRKKQSASCCMASVKAMMRNKYKLAPEEGCAFGFAPNMMRCIDSYNWCEPIGKNSPI